MGLGRGSHNADSYGHESPYSTAILSQRYKKFLLSFAFKNVTLYLLLHATKPAMNRREHRLIEGSETRVQVYCPQHPSAFPQPIGASKS